MLRSKAYFLTCALALTTMFGLNAAALPQKANPVKKPLTRQQPAKLPPQANVVLPVGKQVQPASKAVSQNPRLVETRKATSKLADLRNLAGLSASKMDAPLPVGKSMQAPVQKQQAAKVASKPLVNPQLVETRKATSRLADLRNLAGLAASKMDAPLPVGKSMQAPVQKQQAAKVASKPLVNTQQAAKVASKPVNTQQAPRATTRALSEQTLQKAYQQMEIEAQNNKKAFSAVGTKKNALRSLQAKGLFSKKKAHFPKPKHVVKERAPNGDALTIEDGSAWTIKDKDQKIVKDWSENTPITFVPNKLSLWSKLVRQPLTHKYCIVNLKTKESVQANLSLGPFVHNPYAVRIRKISKPKGEVVFSDGTLWKCDTSKASQALLNDWRIGDFIATGTNNTWFGLGQQEIIINVSSDNWLAAQRLL